MNDILIIGLPFFAGLLVLSTHVPLGREVVKRGIIFTDLAVAQMAGVGIVVASMWKGEHGSSVVSAQLVALSFAMLGAISIYLFEKKWPKQQEAFIGALFVLAATAITLLLARTPHAGEMLQTILVGQILWVQPFQLIITGMLYIVAAGCWFMLKERVGGLLFYLIFALCVTASVQLVGLYLVFASLVIPALATLSLPPKHQLPTAYAIGALSYALGLWLSIPTNLPSAPLVVWVLAVIGIVARILYPRLLKAQSH